MSAIGWGGQAISPPISTSPSSVDPYGDEIVNAATKKANTAVNQAEVEAAKQQAELLREEAARKIRKKSKAAIGNWIVAAQEIAEKEKAEQRRRDERQGLVAPMPTENGRRSKAQSSLTDTYCFNETNKRLRGEVVGPSLRWRPTIATRACPASEPRKNNSTSNERVTRNKIPVTVNLCNPVPSDNRPGSAMPALRRLARTETALARKRKRKADEAAVARPSKNVGDGGLQGACVVSNGPVPVQTKSIASQKSQRDRRRKNITNRMAPSSVPKEPTSRLRKALMNASAAKNGITAPSLSTPGNCRASEKAGPHKMSCHRGGTSSGLNSSLKVTDLDKESAGRMFEGPLKKQGLERKDIIARPLNLMSNSRSQTQGPHIASGSGLLREREDQNPSDVTRVEARQLKRQGHGIADGEIDPDVATTDDDLDSLFDDTPNDVSTETTSFRETAAEQFKQSELAGNPTYPSPSPPPNEVTVEAITLDLVDAFLLAAVEEALASTDPAAGEQHNAAFITKQHIVETREITNSTIDDQVEDFIRSKEALQNSVDTVFFEGTINAAPIAHEDRRGGHNPTAQNPTETSQPLNTAEETESEEE